MQVSRNNTNFNYCSTTVTPTTFNDIMHYQVSLSKNIIMLATDTNTFIRVDGITSTPTVNKTLYNMINKNYPVDGAVWVRTFFEENNEFPTIRLGWRMNNAFRYRTISYDGYTWTNGSIETVNKDNDTEFDSHTWICGVYCNNVDGTDRVEMECHIILTENYYIRITATTNSLDYFYVNFDARYSSTSIRSNSLPAVSGTTNELIPLVSNSGSSAGLEIAELKVAVTDTNERLDDVENTANHAEETANSIASKTSSLFVSR